MISLETIRNLAQLARLKLLPAEEAAVQKDVSAILEYVGQVGKATAPSAVEEKPLVRNVMREDAPYPAGTIILGKRDALLAALPEREGDFAVVRKIIEKDE